MVRRAAFDEGYRRLTEYKQELDANIYFQELDISSIGKGGRFFVFRSYTEGKSPINVSKFKDVIFYQS